MEKRKPKFKIGEVLQVIWSATDYPTIGIIQIESVGIDHYGELCYTFTHLTDTKRRGDTRCLSTVEDLLKAKVASKAIRILYQECIAETYEV